MFANLKKSKASQRRLLPKWQMSYRHVQYEEQQRDMRLSTRTSRKNPSRSIIVKKNLSKKKI